MGGKEAVRKDGQSPASFIVEGGGPVPRLRIQPEEVGVAMACTTHQSTARFACGGRLFGDPLGPSRPPVPLRERTMGNKIFLPAMSGTMAHSGRAFVG